MPARKVGIIGLGYVGLPLGVAFAEAGHEVIGLDADPRKIEALKKGESYIEDVPSERLAALGDALSATADYEDLKPCDAIIICVPTPLSKTKTPDLSYVMSAVESIRPRLRRGQLVVGSTRIESLRPGRFC